MDNYLKKSVSNHRIGYGAFTLKLKEEAISTESVIEQSKLRKRIERLEAQESESTQKILILRETISASENAVEKQEYELMEDSLLKKLITGNKSAAKTLL